MRPSDVPTYVEAGAVDLGITGKDVLMEQHERVVYELLDLGYGYCRMVVATRAGDHFADDLERRLGAIRIATKYPRVAARYFEPSGRQAEVIEVKGSVELAPISGLAEGIVDLTASGRTLRENDLEVREVIADCTARLVANRVVAQAAPGGDRRPRAADRRRSCALGTSPSSRATRATSTRRRGDARAGRAADDVTAAVAEILDEVRHRRRRAVHELTLRFDSEAAPEAVPRAAGADRTPRRRSSTPTCAPGSRRRSRTCERARARQSCPAT